MFENRLNRNLAYVPVTLAPFAIWYFLVGRISVARPLVFLTWIVACFTIANLTVDLTRVFTIITLPTILILIRKALERGGRSAPAVGSCRPDDLLHRPSFLVGP